MLNSYGDLLRFLAESNLLDPQRARLLNKAVTPEAGARALQSVRALREATAGVLYATVEGNSPPQADLRALEKYFVDATRHRELQWEKADGPAGLVWKWGRYENDPDLPLWALTQSVSEILLSDEMTHVRTCAVDTCRWLFLDTSKNHSRRWCNMKVCGNRMKARRFQAKREVS